MASSSTNKLLRTSLSMLILLLSLKQHQCKTLFVGFLFLGFCCCCFSIFVCLFVFKQEFELMQSQFLKSSKTNSHYNQVFKYKKSSRWYIIELNSHVPVDLAVHMNWQPLKMRGPKSAHFQSRPPVTSAYRAATGWVALTRPSSNTSPSRLFI